MVSEGVSEIRTPPETILFAEDEAVIRMEMAEFLRECGFVASSRRPAQAKLSRP